MRSKPHTQGVRVNARPGKKAANRARSRAALHALPALPAGARRQVVSSRERRRPRGERVRVRATTEAAAGPATVSIPINGYQVLGVAEGTSYEACERAAERLTENPDSDYTQGCLEARARVFQIALASVKEGGARRETTVVPVADAVGALVVLQEAQKAEAAVELADLWISSVTFVDWHADVALAGGRALCSMAHAHLDDLQQLPEVFRLLLQARKMVGTHNPSSSLAAQIDEGLMELTPEYLQHCLAEPHPGDPSVRAGALKYLEQVLWAPSSSLALPPVRRLRLMDRIQQFLSPAEVVNLYGSLPAAELKRLPQAESYELAMCTLTEGVLAMQPALVRDAEARFEQLEQTAMRDTHIELAVCAILLSKIGLAQQRLRITPDADLPADPEVLAFFELYSGERDGTLKGLGAFAERWIQSILLADVQTPQHWPAGFNLDVWGESDTVRRCLYGEPAPTPVATRCLLWLSSALHAFFIWFFSPVLRVFGLYKADSSGAVATASRPQQPAWVSGATATIAGPPGGPSATAAAPAAAPSEPSAQPQWRGALMMLLRFVIVAAVGAAVALLVWMRGRGAQRAQPPLIQVSAATQEVLQQGVQEPGGAAAAGEHITLREIENTLLAWMEVKSLAMGPRHDVDALESVLQGPMLREWRERATALQKERWHWIYQLTKVMVQKVRMVRPDTASVVVDLVEKADAMFEEVKQESYEQSVCMEYRLVRSDAGWVISGSRVLES